MVVQIMDHFSNKEVCRVDLFIKMIKKICRYVDLNTLIEGTRLIHGMAILIKERCVK